MTAGGSAAEELKRQVADAALDLVESSTVIGLGTGSTARYLVEGLAERLADGRLEDVKGVPTSQATADLARRLGVPLVELPAEGLSLAIDGMDEVDAELQAIKGLGGALLREKIVAESASRFVLIGDDSKRVARLGERAPLPVEVVPFGWERTARLIADLEVTPTLRERDGRPVSSDNGNLLLDCSLPEDVDVRWLSERLHAVPGVVEHGLFLDLAHLALLAGERGIVTLERSR